MILAILYTSLHSCNSHKNIDTTNNLSGKIITSFEAEKNTLSQIATNCLGGKSQSKEDYNERIKYKNNLISIVMNNRASLPSSLIFDLAKVTHFDDSIAAENLCSFDKSALNNLNNKLSFTQIKITKELSSS